MSVSKKHRFEVFRRDDFQCRHCGKSAIDGAVLELAVTHALTVEGEV